MGVSFAGDEIRKAFDGGIEELGYPDQTGDYRQYCRLCKRNMQKAGNDDHGDSAYEVDPGVVFPDDKASDTGEGIGKAFYSAADRKFLWFHSIILRYSGERGNLARPAEGGLVTDVLDKGVHDEDEQQQDTL